MRAKHLKLVKLAAASLALAGLAACGGNTTPPVDTTPPANNTSNGTTTADTSAGGTTTTGTTGTTTGTVTGSPSVGATTTTGTTGTSTGTVTGSPSVGASTTTGTTGTSTGTVTGGTTGSGTTTSGTTGTSTGTVTGGTSGTTTAAPVAALQVATTFLASLDSSIATSLATTGAASASNFDSCYLGGGRTKANFISNFDADPSDAIASDLYRIGSTRSNLVVTADRNTTNADGTARREIDVQYKINYADGSADNFGGVTLITGSSFGSCATAQNSSDARVFGNRQLVSVAVRAETTRYDQYELRQTLRAVAPGTTSAYPTTMLTSPTGVTSTAAIVPAGEPKAVPVLYERGAQFRIQDPMGNATYAVVTGPGFRTVSGVQTPWSVKMLSPRLLKSDPLLAGKTGNYTSLTDNSTFSFCRLANGNLPGSAALADCAAGGARGSRYLVSMALPTNTLVPTEQAAAADAALAGAGLVAGTYTFKIYNDDGWKTIDGQAGKTPIATYTAQLGSLPVSFVDMNVTSNRLNDKFPKISSPRAPAAVAASLLAGLAFSETPSWTAPLFVGANPFKLSFVEAYNEGTVALNGIGFPRVANFVDIYPGSNATSRALNVPANPANMGYKTYAEFQVNYTNRNGVRIKSIVSFN